jgi:tetratricopeptide (TPR) repeat protein
MKIMQGFKRQGMLMVAVSGLIFLSGCQEQVVYQRSMADLNQKAQAMMQAGDYAGAVSRLEAAHDLQPEEPNTMHNLAVAYQMNGNYDKAIVLFTKLLDKNGMDKAEMHKNLGIAYESQADQLTHQARELEGEDKPDAAKVAELNQEAERHYKLATEHYQQALAAGVKNQGEVETQIRALQARLDNKTGMATR